FAHAQYFILADVQRAAERVFMRAVVEQRVSDEFLCPDQKARALWATNRFASAESDQVISHVGIVPQMGDGRRIRSGVVEGGNLIFMRQGHPLVNFDLPGGVGKI